MKLSALPALLQPLEGGLFAGVCTTPDGTHHAVVLLTEQPAERLTWKKAMNWAEKLGAVLPTRPVAALLFANAKAQFEPEWHWTSESFDGSYAWGQDFSYGDQSDLDLKSYEGRARAVRLIQLTP
jgi:hypothetical protein